MATPQQPPVYGQQPGPMVEKKRKIRFFTWFILALNALFLVWLIFGISGVANGTCDAAMSQEACNAAKAIGGGIGALLIIFIWVAADVILGIIWLVTRKKQPTIVYVQQPPSTS